MKAALSVGIMHSLMNLKEEHISFKHKYKWLMNKKFFRQYTGFSGHLALCDGQRFTMYRSIDRSHIMVAPLT